MSWIRILSGNREEHFQRKDGKRNGICKVKVNGKIVQTCTYRNGQLDGNFKGVNVEKNYSEGLLHGEYRVYRKNLLVMFREYKKGKLHGSFIHYEVAESSNGLYGDVKEKSHHIYHEGRLHGVATFRNGTTQLWDNGLLVSESRIVNERRELYFYDEKGKLHGVCRIGNAAKRYEHGVCKLTLLYDANDRLLSIMDNNGIVLF